jgi:uncharacterized membrane protein (UPF0182 family)
MIIFPLGKHILYIQPFYLEATGRLKIPELKRVIVSAEQIVVIDVTLEKAFDRLNKLIIEQDSRETIIPAPDSSSDQIDEVIPLPSEPELESDLNLEPEESLEKPPDPIYHNDVGE